MTNKPNDFFATFLFQPQTTFEDLAAEGLTADNTGLESRDYYKSIPKVQETFVSKDGNFDETTFNNFYDNMLVLYNDYAKKDYEKILLDNVEYNPDVWWAPKDSKKMDTRTEIQFGKNPMKISSGVNYLTQTSKPTMSIRELAQANVVKDSETGESLGWTPNEKGGLFKSFSRPTLVLATWDEDGFHEEDGVMVQHLKGEYKFDKDGSPYYETLGDREIYGKDVLHYTDTFTVDGSKMNKYDFFDSDGLDKTIGGTLMKTAATVLPMLIPYVGPVIGGITAAVNLAQLVPVVGKSINGLVSNNDTSFGQSLNKLEGYLERFTPSTSDYSRNKMVTAENLGNLVGQISTQLFQQKAVGMIPGLLGDPTNIKNVKLGQKMALAYMAGTSARDTYSSFRSAGASEEVAGLAMLASTFALYGLMNSNYLGYKDSLFKGSWLDESVSKAPAWNVAQEWSEKYAKENVEAAVENAAKNKNLFNWFQNRFKDNYGKVLNNSTFAARSLNEGIEEVLEEAVVDLTKAITAAGNALGLKVTEDNKTLNFGYTLEDTLARYAMSFGGGVLGGAIFQMHGKWDDFLHNKFLEKTEVEDLSKLTYMIAEGRAEEIRDYYRKWHKEGRLGSTNLGSKFETVDGIDGKTVVNEAAVAGSTTHNDIVFEALMKQIDLIENILSEEGLKINEKTLGEVLKLGGDERGMVLADTFVKTGLFGSFLNEFNRLGTTIVKKRAELDAALAELAPKGDTANKTEESNKSIKNNERIKTLEEELKELRKERDAILNGERNDKYMGQIFLMMNDDVNKFFLQLTKDNFARGKYNKDYNSLSQVEKDFIDQEYEDYSKVEGRNDLYRAWDVYSGLSEIWAPKIQEVAESLVGYSETTGYKGQYGAEFFRAITNVRKLEQTKEELNAKESLTPEEAEKLAQAQKSLDELNIYFNQIEANPELATQQILDDETIKSFRLLGLDAPIENILGESAKILENNYTKARDAKTVLPDDNDLNGFFSTYLKTRYNVSPEVKFREMLTAVADPNSPLDFDWIEDLIESGGEAFAADDGNIFDIQFNDRSQRDFIEQIKIFVESLGSDNAKAVKAYNEAERLLREYSRAPEEVIEFVMDYFFGKINNESIADFIKRIDDIRKDIKYHPFEDLFAEFVVTINGHESKILDLLRSEEKHLAAQERLANYSIESDALKKELEEVQHLLNAFKGIIHGSFDGLNKNLNPYRKSAKHPEFANIDESAARILLEDAERLQAKIDTLLRLNEAAQSRKLKIQQRIASNMRPKFIKSIFSEPFVENIKSVFGDEFGKAYSEIWENIEKPDGYTTLLDINVKESNYGEWDRVFINAETEVFELFKSFFGRDIYKKDFAEKVIKLFGEDLYKMVSTRLSDNTDEIVENYDAMVYFATLVSFNTQDFYTKYKEVVEDPNFPFAPIFSQEMAVKENYAMALRPDLFNNIAELLKATDHPDTYIANKKVLQNVIMTLGGAGTGKTTSIANIVIKMLDGKDLDVVAITPTTDQLTKLKNSIEKPEIKGYTKDEIFKLITTNPNGIGANNIEYDEKASTVQPKDIDASDTVIYDSGKKIRVFVIDEIGCFNKIELELLSKYAAKHNILVMGLGDFKQTSAVIRLKDKDGNERPYPNGIDDFVYIKTPSLTASLRVDNVAKLYNYNVLNDLSETITREYQKNPTWSPDKIDDELSKYLASRITLKYYSERSRIIGEKFVDDSTQLIDEINRVKGRGSILIIADDPAKYSSIQGVEVRGSDNVNGAEADYVFVDKNWKNHSSSKFDLLRDLYTVSQRSRKATIMINNGITTELIINNEPDPNTNQNYSQDSRAIDDFKKWRLEHLAPIHESENFEENTSYYKLNTTPVVPPKKEETEEKPKKETPPPVKPKESPKAEKAETPAEPVNDPAIEPEVKEEVEPERDGEVKQEPFKSVEEIVETEQKSGRAPMNLGDFYSTIYDRSFIARESDKVDSSYNWFRGKITDKEYIQFVNLLAGLIRRNYNPANDKDFTLITRQFANNKTVRVIKEFKKLIDTHGYDIRLEAISPELSELYLVTKDIRTYIGTIHSGKSGVYKGTFTQVAKADYNRSEQTQRIRVSNLSTIFPGIRVGRNWGIVSHSNDSNIPESVRAWTARNNGKSMILCSDDPLFTEKEIAESFRTTFYETTDEAGNATREPWAIANRDFLTLAGLQKRATPSEVIRYAIAMHYKRTGKDLDSAVSILLDKDTSTLSLADKENAIEDYITNYARSARDIIRPLPNAGREAFASFYKRLSHTDYNILSGDFRLGEFIAKCINNPKIQEPVLKNLSAMLMRDSKIGKSKSSVGKKNILRVTIGENIYDIEWKDNNWYSVHLPSGNIENINLGGVVYPFNSIIEKIGELENIDNPVVTNITVWEKTKDGLYPENMNETLYYLFYGGGTKINMAVLDDALDGEFLFAQDAAGEPYKNSVWRKHVSSKDSSDDFDGYTTTASNWRYSIFAINDSDIITGSEQKIDRTLADIDRFNGLKEEVDEFIKGTSLKAFNYEYTPSMSPRETVEDYIRIINDRESTKQDSWIFNYLEIDPEDDRLQIINFEDVDLWIKNLLETRESLDITIYDDFKTHPTWKYLNFSVTLDSEVQNFIVRNINGKWVLSPFNSASVYNEMMSVLRPVINTLPETDRRAIKEYVLSIQMDNTTIEMAEAYNNVIGNYPEINQVVMNYLIKRLELNEC